MLYRDVERPRSGRERDVIDAYTGDKIGCVDKFSYLGDVLGKGCWLFVVEGKTSKGCFKNIKPRTSKGCSWSRSWLIWLRCLAYRATRVCDSAMTKVPGSKPTSDYHVS